MKTKHLFIFLASLILASLACQKPDLSEPARVSTIQTTQPYFATPDNWQEVPQSCFNSLTQISYTINQEGFRSSATVIETETIHWKDGKDYHLYYLVTSNHTDTGFTQGAPFTISAGFQGRQDFQYTIVNSLVVADDHNSLIDAVLVAVIGENKAITPLNEGPLPISSTNLLPGISLSKDEYFYSIGYPKGSWLPQFVKGKTTDNIVIDSINLYKKIIFEISDDSKSVNVDGYSGGPICNSSGQIVGVVQGSDYSLGRFFATPFPVNIAAQYQYLKDMVSQNLKAP